MTPVSCAPLLAEQPAFLGVAASVTGRRWQERCGGASIQNHIAKMVQAHGLPELCHPFR